ncbi:chloroplast lipoate protein ligase [Auriscalpium vulgare]|uniref:Chloroplast lipoate protein ligase n=1 Tax=Auriscalpium vulgare TaxID=40419 RepID=A0ACB8RSI0_9AGAM|nr:chloroplast lipoate protein ligase [Auriscalpium vulgare]
MLLPPIFYHYFTTPLPYLRTLKLQESIHSLQLSLRRTSGSHKDVLLLLEHRPVYTSGRRQTEDEVANDLTRLTNIGADFVLTQRGGQLTYHGPGQIVGYPLIDLSRTSPAMGIRDYIARMQTLIELHLSEGHGIEHVPTDHTGVFLDPVTKIGSIGVQVRHRLTSHGFAFNVTREPRAWFDEIVACGLEDVRAGSIESATGKTQSVRAEIPGLVERFGKLYGREMQKLDVGEEGELSEMIAAVEEDAKHAGEWLNAPLPPSNR